MTSDDTPGPAGSNQDDSSRMVSDFWTQQHPYPALEQRSITQPMPLGRTPDRTPIGPILRDSSAYLWGRRGSGKTVVTADIIAAALQCTDTLVWTVGDERARMFLRSYVDGRVAEPPIDWVADSGEEFAAMVGVAVNIALARRAGYTDLRYEHNTNSTPVGTGHDGKPPHILIVVDDDWMLRQGAASQDIQRREDIQRLLRLARAGAITIVQSGLRATGDYTSAEALAASPVRIAMGVTDDADLHRGFGTRGGLAPLRRPTAGSGHIRTGPDALVTPFKAFYLDPERIDLIGAETASWRPRMDDLSRRAATGLYSSRWQRTGARLFPDGKQRPSSY